MKNVFLPRKLVEQAAKYDATEMASGDLALDLSVTSSFEKMNPLLSNGHRLNIITQLMDPTVPEEVRAVLSQFAQKGVTPAQVSDMSDEELLNTLPSRYCQSQPQLHMLREQLAEYADYIGIGREEPEPDDVVAPVEETPIVESKSD